MCLDNNISISAVALFIHVKTQLLII